MKKNKIFLICILIIIICFITFNIIKNKEQNDTKKNIEKYSIENEKEEISAEEESILDNLFIDENILEKINEEYYELKINLTNKEIKINKQTYSLSDFFGMSEEIVEKIADFSEYFYDYLKENLIGDVLIEDDEIKIENPFSLKNIIIKTDHIEEIEKDQNIVSMDNLVNNYYCVKCKSALLAKSKYEELIDNSLMDDVFTDLLIEVDGNISEDISPQSIPDNYIAWGVESTGLDHYRDKINYEYNSKEIKVAVLDTGVLPTHEVFNNKSRLDLTLGYNYIDNNTNTTDTDGHGTKVAGIIAESTSDNVKIVPIKVVDNEGMANVSNVIKAVNNIINYVDTINISLSGVLSSNAKKLEDVVLKKAYDNGVIVVASAGNEASNANGNMYPSDSPYTLSISATDKNHNIASFSNYGDRIDFSAPGDELILPYYTGNNDYVYASGTSFSAPIAVAAIAMIKSNYPDYTYTQVIEELKKNTTDYGQTGKDIYYGWGEIDFASNMFSVPIIPEFSIYTTSAITLRKEVHAVCNEKISRYTLKYEDEAASWINIDEPATNVSISIRLWRNGTYYLWFMDEDKDIGKYTFTVNIIDETVPIPDLTVTIKGKNSIGEVLTTNVETNSKGGREYQWWYSPYASGTDRTYISGATNATFTITENLVDLYIGCTVYLYKPSSENYRGCEARDITDKTNNISAKVKKSIVSIPVANTNLSYTGKEITGIKSTNYYTVSNGTGTNAGTYSATLSLTDNNYYIWEDGTTTNKTISWEIKPKNIEVVWEEKNTYTYNGKEQGPIATVESGVSGETLNITATKGTNAGTYTSIVTLNSVTGGTAKTSNYTLTNTSKKYTIDKANSVAPVVMLYEGIYSGKEQTIVVSGGSGGTIKYSTDNINWTEKIPTRTDVGETVIYIKIEGDSNHNDSSIKTSTITINKKELDVIANAQEKIYGEDNPNLTYTYKGQIENETPKFTGTLETNANKTSTVGKYDITIGSLKLQNNDKFKADNYSIKYTGEKLTIVKANPTYTIPSGLIATKGQVLGDVSLPKNFSWEQDLKTSVGNEGENTFTCTYTPEDTTNYNIIKGIEVKIKVKEKIELIITIDDTLNVINDQDDGKTYITNVNANTTIEEIEKHISTNGVIKIMKLNDEIKDNTTTIGTGMIIKISYQDEEKEYVIVVLGDITGEGKITARDLSILKSSIIDKIILEGTLKKAGDLNGDGKITARDLSILKNIIIKEN